MKRSLVTLILCCAGLAGIASGQTVRTWTSGADQRWNRNANWSGNNQPNANNEVAQFGTGLQLNPQLNANNYVVRGLQFSAGAAAYDVGDDNGARTLKIGNSTSGFITNLSGSDQTISIATLQFQSAATITTAGTGALTLSSDLKGNNRNLTFDATGDINVSGGITTTGGSLTKLGAGDLILAGTNTYTGATTIGAGSLVLQADTALSGTSDVIISSGATLRLSDLTPTISRVDGSGAIDFGLAGTGQLTLTAGASLFAGAFLGSGELVIGAGAVLTLGADFTNTALHLTLDGGTLNLAGHSFTAGALQVTGNSVIDFGAAANSSLAVDSLGFASTGLALSVQNWTDAADYFFSQTGYVQGAAPLNQVDFQGWTTADTRWQSFDAQVTPVPEPRLYGAGLLALVLAAGWWRRGGRPVRDCQLR